MILKLPVSRLGELGSTSLILCAFGVFHWLVTDTPAIVASTLVYRLVSSSDSCVCTVILSGPSLSCVAMPFLMITHELSNSRSRGFSASPLDSNSSWSASPKDFRSSSFVRLLRGPETCHGSPTWSTPPKCLVSPHLPTWASFPSPPPVQT